MSGRSPLTMRPIRVLLGLVGFTALATLMPVAYAINNDTSLANPGGGDGNTTPVMGGFAAPAP